MRITSITLSTVFAFAVVACGHDARPPQAPGAALNGVSTTNAPQPKGSGNDAVSMSGDLRRVCGIDDTGAAPKFGFDSAILGPGDRSELDQLATCMTTGPLKGQNVALVGRADPRGEAEYNMNLGATRASAVEHYLAQLGIAGTRLTTTSRGSLDARGHDDATWAADRRVDLSLAGR